MEQPSNLFDLQVDQQGSAFLKETASWAKFFAILGFIGCALAVLFAFFAGSIFSAMFGAMGAGMGAGMGAMMSMGGAFFAVIYLLIALLYFFPCYYMYNFATKMKTALATQDQLLLNSSFKNLKSCFRFVGILTIIFLSLYLLILLVAIVAGSMAR